MEVKFMSKLKEANKKIENAVVGSYKKIEDTVVNSYKKVEDKFIDAFLAEEGESTEDARTRVKEQIAEREYR